MMTSTQLGGVGIVRFQRESNNPLHNKHVLYVLGLKKNLFSVATLEDKGYDVILSRGKSCLKYLTSGSAKKIGVRMKNLYRL